MNFFLCETKKCICEISKVPPGRSTVGVMRKPVPGASRLYVFQDRNISCVYCSFSHIFPSVGKKFAADHFKDGILTSLK